MKGCALALMLAVVLPIYWQKESSKAATNEQHTQDTKKPDTPRPQLPADAGVVINQEASNCQCDNAKPNPTSYLSRLFSPERISLALACWWRGP